MAAGDDDDDDRAEVKTRFVQVVYSGRWRLDGRLGVGGMGNVLLATDLETQQQVAIKTLGAQFVDKPEFVKRFEREGQLLAKMNHPGLPPLIAQARHEGMPFFVMKYVEGRTLGALMLEKKRLAPLEAIALLRQLADVLEYLHARGVVHRDLKPDNLMVDAAGRITLLDFGISAQTDVTRLTLPGVALGTPLFMAPEIITSGIATSASDGYALGLLAYVMLVGRHPFSHEDRAGMLTRQVNEVPKSADLVSPDIPTIAGQVLQKALSKTPDHRFASATKFIDALASAYGLNPTDSTPDVGPTPDDEFAPAPTQIAPPGTLPGELMRRNVPTALSPAASPQRPAPRPPLGVAPVPVTQPERAVIATRADRPAAPSLGDLLDPDTSPSRPVITDDDRSLERTAMDRPPPASTRITEPSRPLMAPLSGEYDLPPDGATEDVAPEPTRLDYKTERQFRLLMAALMGLFLLSLLLWWLLLR